jgi:hypothetical protein
MPRTTPKAAQQPEKAVIPDPMPAPMPGTKQPMPDGPAPMSQGTYAVYPLPDGGALLVYRPRDADTVRVPIPAMFLQAAIGMAHGDLPLPGPVRKLIEKRFARNTAAAPPNLP